MNASTNACFAPSNAPAQIAESRLPALPAGESLARRLLPSHRQQLAECHVPVGRQDHPRVDVAVIDLIEELAASAARGKEASIVFDGDDPLDAHAPGFRQLGDGRVLGAEADAAFGVDADARVDGAVFGLERRRDAAGLDGLRALDLGP